MIRKERVKKILVITLSNIGDAVLTTPVIAALRRVFPVAELAVLVGPRARDVFTHDRRVNEVIVYDKRAPLRKKLSLLVDLRRKRYDLLIDLRNSAFGFFLGIAQHTPLGVKAPPALKHMLTRHLWKLNVLGIETQAVQGPSLEWNADDEKAVERLWQSWQIGSGQRVVAIAPGARNKTKSWEKSGYTELVRRLAQEYKAKIVMVGDTDDYSLAQQISAAVADAVNTCGEITITQLACLLSKCSLVISNDSAPMHIAWAVNTPVIAIFGPTDYCKYAPQGARNIVMRKELACSPCGESLCPKNTRECLIAISADEVFTACKEVLNGTN